MGGTVFGIIYKLEQVVVSGMAVIQNLRPANMTEHIFLDVVAVARHAPE
jgi:hypothetical protein